PLLLFQNLHFLTLHQQIHLKLIFFQSFSFSFHFIVYSTFASVFNTDTSSLTCSSISPSKFCPVAFSAVINRSIVFFLVSTSSSSKSISSFSYFFQVFFLV